MALRDQPVLDRYQDAIFRLPIDRRLLLLGPPGTGKTTTLIRRLGQKLDMAALDNAETSIIESLARAGGAPHSESWIMFTPTELLQKYLKEAFNREGVAAPDARIRTWSDVRRELGREVFGLLRTENGGTFILRETLQVLSTEATENSRNWHDDFASFEIGLFLDDLMDSARQLGASDSTEAKAVSERLERALKHSASASLSDVFESLVIEAPLVRSILEANKLVTDDKGRKALNLQANKDKHFLDSLASFLDSLQAPRSAEEEDSEDQDTEEDEDALPTRTPKAAAAHAYLRALRAKARALAAKRSVPKGKNSQILHWLGTRIPESEELVEMGRSLLLQASARRFTDPVRRYRNGIPKRYRAFRRLRQSERRWYSDAQVGGRDLHPLELDLILMRILRVSADLIAIPGIRRDVSLPHWTSLQPLVDQLRSQVFVDEATDFSYVQLACMAALAEPRLKSFFICGDFNQRLTNWGVRAEEDLKTIFADLEITRVNTGYRQSRQLNELARSLIAIIGESDPGVVIPEHTADDGQPPALVENCQGDGLASWLTARIRDIERLVGQLPTIAVFVNGDAAVGPMAELLSARLSEHNIPVEACREGKTVGQDNSVRVFDIQHIKGLEFESVFFVGIDKLASEEPKLFDRYLYVGTTRAATFLGLTCEARLPKPLESLRSQFVGGW